jgi:ADP-heptose:LPS heptosyltransferase
MKKIGIVLTCAGMGDILSSTPIIRYLYKIYNYKIPVFTYNVELFKNSPYVNIYEYSEHEKFKNEYELIYTFQIDKSVHTRINLVQLHSKSVGVELLPSEMSLDFFPDKDDIIKYLPKRYIVIHPTKTWPSRTWPFKNWQKLTNMLNDNNIEVISIGKDSSEIGTYNTQKPVFNIKIKKGINLLNKLTIHQTWHIINNSMMLIAMDSGILHLAGTTDVNIIQLGSSINPFFRTPYRNSSQSYKLTYIKGDCDLFCASDSFYAIKHNNNHRTLPPIPFCLKHPETIGDTNNIDENIYRCHPSTDKVYKSILKIIDS